MLSDILTITLIILGVIVLLVLLKVASDDRRPYHHQVKPVQIVFQDPDYKYRTEVPKQDPFPYKGCHDDSKRCDGLNKMPLRPAPLPHGINETPGFVNFPSVCQSAPKPNLALAEAGTVAEPSNPIHNEYPAPFAPMKPHCQTKINHHFNPEPSNDGRDETFGFIDYQTHGPIVSGFACTRPSGNGEPAYEKKNEFPAEFKSISEIGGSCSSCKA